MISAPNWNDGNGAVGRVYLVEGHTGNILHVVQGDEADSFFGWSIAPVGDITGNSVTDFAVGAPSAGYSEGRVYLYDGLTGQLIDQIDGTLIGGLFGASLSGAGDLNADGFDDFAVGAPGTNRNTGRVYVYSGATRALICEINGQASQGTFGIAIDGGHDVNGDGMPNLVVGAPGVPNSALSIELHTGQSADMSETSPYAPEDIHSYGRAYVFSASALVNHGASEPLPAASADLILVPSVAGDIDYGIRVEIGNDVTLDGLANIIVASTYEDDDGPFMFDDRSPRTYIHSGVDGSIVQHYTLDDDVEDMVDYENTGGCPPCPPHCPLCPPVMETCEQMAPGPCKDACHCINALIRKYNRRVRNYNRAARTATAVCVLACISTPVTGPVGLGVCITCGVGTVSAASWVVMDIRNFISDGWEDCFIDNGCVPPPPFPYE